MKVDVPAMRLQLPQDSTHDVQALGDLQGVRIGVSRKPGDFTPAPPDPDEEPAGTGPRSPMTVAVHLGSGVRDHARLEPRRARGGQPADRDRRGRARVGAAAPDPRRPRRPGQDVQHRERHGDVRGRPVQPADRPDGVVGGPRHGQDHGLRRLRRASQDGHRDAPVRAGALEDRDPAAHPLRHARSGRGERRRSGWRLARS